MAAASGDRYGEHASILTAAQVRVNRMLRVSNTASGDAQPREGATMQT
jgi:hypothetical protein